MTETAPPQARWWGWIEPGDPPALSRAALWMMQRELGVRGERTPPVPLGRVRVPPRRIGEALERRLRAIVGDAHVRGDQRARVMHAAGKSYVDLVRLRCGHASSAPDLVVAPGSAAEVAALLDLCSEERVAVVPFGGGTSVVGGVEPRSDGFAGAISLELGRLDGLNVDRVSLTASCGPGLRSRVLEPALARDGLTLGHFPQSHELASIGGYVATRSAGQASTGYGRIDELVLGARLQAPAGELVARTVPASAAGPDLRDLIVGSEGALGVIVEATLSLHRRPSRRRYEGWSFETFEQGADALRTLVQRDGARPDVARLSDRAETRATLAFATTGSVGEQAGRLYLRARGHGRGCLAIVGFEGDADSVNTRASRAHRVLRAAGGLSLGERPGAAWQRGRYVGPYLRDELLDHGLLVETLETATTWSRLPALHAAVGRAIADALAARGTPALVGCHVSHLYRAGASLYFTFMARREDGAEVEQWRAAKVAASEAIVANGGTITHHHAVGSDHAPWMQAEVGPLGVELLRDAKRRLDPAGVMNPGKLIR